MLMYLYREPKLQVSANYFPFPSSLNNIGPMYSLNENLKLFNVYFSYKFVWRRNETDENGYVDVHD